MERARIREYHVEYRWIESLASGGSTLVFLHEGLGSVSLWRDFPDVLCARTRCRGFVYSRRGHGGSDPLEARSAWYIHEEALLALPPLLEAVRIDDAILVGHSDGGSIALIATGAGRVTPRALILEAPHVLVEEVTLDGIRRTRERYATTDLRDRLARHHGTVDALFERWSGVWLSPEFRSWNIEAYAARVTCPTLVIQGRDDEYGTTRQVDLVAAAVGGPCETLILDDCGHTPHADQRNAVERAMADFIAGVLRGRGAGE